MARTWFDRRTHDGRQWSLDQLLEAKRSAAQRLTVVIPARNEAATVGDVVGRIHAAFVEGSALVDELVVIDGESTDDTAAIAAAAGATVHRLTEIRPDLGTRVGKGEAMWKSQFVTSGDIVAFVDADLTQWDTHFVTGLVGPLLTDPAVALVKGFYERPYRSGATYEPQGGGRVTELVARPMLAIARPELTQVVQPLAGEWAVRREVYETLRVPIGYGVDLAALIDVADRLGIDAIAQVDLGVRAHSHQSLHDLGPMSVQLMAAVLNRARQTLDDHVPLRQFRALRDGYAPVVHDVDVTERPPAVEVAR
ncbi:glucosyl-3-phosphoglycerate synthase [Aeromicrobium flavum]|uniref:glucosyl-3-phosphoglycerate synthase n=1 Tax=Aeromicrobium flavum TaxID=416568 RepID=UPI0011BE4459|nr:glucosyl-3-phosphoglycerate synthase [Aeromicrobium flavum]